MLPTDKVLYLLTENANSGINGFSLAVNYSDECVLWAKDSSLIGQNIMRFYVGKICPKIKAVSQ